jgi:hypothetical protein
MSPTAGPGGKLTHRLDVPVAEADMEALIALAAVAGVTKAEYARWVLRRAIWGEMSMLRSVARSGRAAPSDDDGTTPLRGADA